MSGLHMDMAFCERVGAVLEEMHQNCRSLLYALVLTDDGFEVANNGGDAAGHRRVASMASSIQALGDAVANEVQMGGANYLIIAGEQGNFIQLGIPGYDLILVAYFADIETVGKALSIARLASQEISQIQAEVA